MLHQQLSKLIIGSLGLLILLATFYARIIIEKGILINQYFELRTLYFLIALGAITTVVSYTFSKNMIFGWYVPVYLLPLLWSFLGFYSLNRAKIYIILTSIIILNPILSTISICDQAIWSRRNITISSSNARVRTYVEIGKWLDAKYKNETLMTSEIGGLGYGYKGYIYDGGGLISPDALKYHPITYPEQQRVAIPLGYIKEKDPDIIVSFDTFITEFLDSEIVDNYVRIKRPAFISDDREKFHEVFGSSYINIFIHKRVYKP